MLNDQTAGFTEEELLEHILALRRFAKSFHASPSDIDDLVQETLAKAIAFSKRFERGTQLPSWLFTIMRNTFCSKFNISKRERVGFGGLGRVGGHPGRELEVAISTMLRHFRSVFDLVVIQGASYEAAASQFGVPIGTIKSRVNRARSHLVEDEIFIAMELQRRDRACHAGCGRT
jgi:DNA-directed RNA polymerase specialized sigma24 family protein